MYLKTLHLRQFRNYRDQQISFEAPKIIVVGNNAQGKSNLLEAVELLSTLKSHRTSRDRDLIWNPPKEGTSALESQISSTLERQMGTVDLKIVLRANGRRSVALNSEFLRRQLDFLGTLNAVHFSSLDIELVRGSPERRRLWLDTLLTQLEPFSAYLLQQYNQILRQRNALLKSKISTPEEMSNGEDDLNFALSPQSLPADFCKQLALWDAQLVTVGSRLMRRRARVIERLAPIARAWHGSISGSGEVLEIRYAPNVRWDGDSRAPVEAVQQAFWEKLQQKAIAERVRRTSLVGAHRDDVELAIDRTPARQYGSQGQQRTLVLALKLAELKLISEVVGESPLLLLDDVLAELDLNRQNQLLEAIADRFQTLITTTHLSAFDSRWLDSSQVLHVEAGKISSQLSF